MSLDKITISAELEIDEISRGSGFCALNDAKFALYFHQAPVGGSQRLVMSYKTLTSAGIDLGARDDWRYNILCVSLKSRKLDDSSNEPLHAQINGSDFLINRIIESKEHQFVGPVFDISKPLAKQQPPIYETEGCNYFVNFYSMGLEGKLCLRIDKPEYENLREIMTRFVVFRADFKLKE